MVKITPSEWGRTKKGNQPLNSKFSGSFPLYYATYTVELDFIRASKKNDLNLFERSQKFILLIQPHGVNFKILQLIMIIIPWNSVGTSFEELLGGF